MKRWIYALEREAEAPKVGLFLKDLLSVCKKHGFSIGHEDTQGSFIIYPYEGEGDDTLTEWLLDASVDETVKMEDV